MCFRCILPRSQASNKLIRRTRKQTVCICENKGTDQLRGNREVDQRLCFYLFIYFYLYNVLRGFSLATQIVRSIFLNPKFQASSFLQSLYSLVCIRPARNPKLLVFSCTCSAVTKAEHDLVSKLCFTAIVCFSYDAICDKPTKMFESVTEIK